MRIQKVSAGKLVANQYTSYGEYVNLHRHIPNIEDGCKMSYRHLIQTAYEQPENSMIKTAALIGTNMRCLHPHSDMAQKDIVTELVRKGIFEGQGNFGCEFLVGGDAPCAATRYTECRLSKRYRDLITPLANYVPKFTNELNYQEFEYLPLPIPIALTIGYIGIGLGTGTKIPAFTPESLYEAYVHDDPWYLKSRYGLIIDKDSQLDRLWEEGRGRIFYKLNTYDDPSTGKYYIEGLHGPVKINFSKLIAWKDDGRIDFDDETSEGKPKIGFYKMPRVQWPSYEELVEEIDKAAQGAESYIIRVVKNNSVVDIGIRDWLTYTYQTYKKMLTERINDQIKDLKSDIVFYKNFRDIADKMLKYPDKSYEDIAKELKIDISVVNRASSRTLSTLRNYDPSGKVAGCESKIKELKNFNSDKYISECVINM